MWMSSPDLAPRQCIAITERTELPRRRSEHCYEISMAIKRIAMIGPATFSCVTLQDVDVANVKGTRYGYLRKVLNNELIPKLLHVLLYGHGESIRSFEESNARTE